MSEETPLLNQPPAQAPPPAYAGTATPPPYQANTDTGQPPPTVVQVQPQTTVYAIPFSDVPTQLTCQNCHQNVLTKLDYTAGALAWIMVLALFLLGFALPCFWLGCCFIPLCIKGVKDVNHICPNCGRQMGTYKRL